MLLKLQYLVTLKIPINIGFSYLKVIFVVWNLNFVIICMSGVVDINIFYVVWLLNYLFRQWSVTCGIVGQVALCNYSFLLFQGSICFVLRLSIINFVLFSKTQC